MKHLSAKSLSLAAMLLAGLCTQASAQGRAHTLDCISGDDMRSSLNIGTGGLSDSTLRIWFNAATRGSPQRPLSPGECAWQDRGLNADEPRQIWIRNLRFSGNLTVRGGQIVLQSHTPPDSAALNALMRPGTPFSLRVRNEGPALVAEFE